MKNIRNKFMEIISNLYSSLQNYPATMILATSKLVLTWIEIELIWPTNTTYSFLMDVLQLSLTFGIVFNLLTESYILNKSNPNVKLLKIAGIIAPFLIFLLIFNFGSTTSFNDYKVISNLSAVRVTTLSVFCLLGFVITTAQLYFKKNISKSLFIIQKYGLISLLYFLVLIIGLFSVTAAFQTLVYDGLSQNVYQYIYTTSVFVAFSIFVGSYSSLCSLNSDNHYQLAVKPKYIELLLRNVLVPVMFAFSAVLILWVIRTVLQNQDPEFIEISTITTTYIFTGLWLHIMVTDSESNIENIYKKLFPKIVLGMLVFQLYILVIQIIDNSVMTAEYYFIIIWVTSMISLVFLIKDRASAHKKIILTYIIGFTISILPIFGYHNLPPMIQDAQLRSILEENEMLVDGLVVPGIDIDEDSKLKISRKVSFLLNQEEYGLPRYLQENFSNSKVFKEQFGFDMVWKSEVDDGYKWLNINLESTAIDISGYDFFIGNRALEGDGNPIVFNKNGNDFKIRISSARNDDTEITVYMNQEELETFNLKTFVADLVDKYYSVSENSIQVAQSELTFTGETADIEIRIIIAMINVDSYDGSKDIYIELESILFRVK